MRTVAAVGIALALGACSILPGDGPAAGSVDNAAAEQGPLPYAFVNLDYAATQVIATHPPTPLESLAKESSNAPIDLIAVGDTLAISVFEPGPGGLFSHPGDLNTLLGGAQTVTPGVRQALPSIVVARDGTVNIPYAGAVRVEGLMPSEAAEAIRKALASRAVEPQVTLTVADSHANSVGVLGEVKNSGNYALLPYRERLLDLLAIAGGPTKEPWDLLVAVDRGNLHAEAILSDVMSDSAENIRLAPKDVIRVIPRPRKYSVFGAFIKPDQTAITDETLTLAGAVGRAGGLDTDSAHADYVMVFRFERPEVANALGVSLQPAAKGVPIVYRLNFRDPQGIFLANNFEMRADDLLYVPRAPLTELKKFLGFVNEISQINYNFSVTTTTLR